MAIAACPRCGSGTEETRACERCGFKLHLWTDIRCKSSNPRGAVSHPQNKTWREAFRATLASVTPSALRELGRDLDREMAARMGRPWWTLTKGLLILFIGLPLITAVLPAGTSTARNESRILVNSNILVPDASRDREQLYAVGQEFVRKRLAATRPEKTWSSMVQFPSSPEDYGVLNHGPNQFIVVSSAEVRSGTEVPIRAIWAAHIEHTGNGQFALLEISATPMKIQITDLVPAVEKRLRSIIEKCGGNSECIKAEAAS